MRPERIPMQSMQNDNFSYFLSFTLLVINCLIVEDDSLGFRVDSQFNHSAELVILV